MLGGIFIRLKEGAIPRSLFCILNFKLVFLVIFCDFCYDYNNVIDGYWFHTIANISLCRKYCTLGKPCPLCGILILKMQHVVQAVETVCHLLHITHYLTKEDCYMIVSM